MTRRSIRRGQGYLLVDHTASGGGKHEADMLNCWHCQQSMERPLWADDGGYCHCCDGPICASCADRMPTTGCENFLRRLEGALDRKYRSDQLAKVLGV